MELDKYQYSPKQVSKASVKVKPNFNRPLYTNTKNTKTEYPTKLVNDGTQQNYNSLFGEGDLSSEYQSILE